ncbi:MAG: DUF1330 domain-containing protein [Candidatus Dormiibacterota bacterium]
MAGYVLALVEWTDEAGRQRYRDLLSPTLAKYEGELIVATTEVDAVEGDWQHAGILVLIRFPTVDRARSWYASEEYQPALRARQESSRSRLMIFEGD